MFFEDVRVAEQLLTLGPLEVGESKHQVVFLPSSRLSQSKLFVVCGQSVPWKLDWFNEHVGSLV